MGPIRTLEQATEDAVRDGHPVLWPFVPYCGCESSAGNAIRFNPNFLDGCSHAGCYDMRTGTDVVTADECVDGWEMVARCVKWNEEYWAKQ